MAEKGKLFLCATPIGNLDDVTARLAKVLSQVELVAAENTAQALKLLNRLAVRKKLLSYHEHNKLQAGPKLIDFVAQGRDAALISDAGYPAIADPGEHLVRLALERGIEVVPVPGANAALCALVASGMETAPFFFGGFLPRTKKRREETLMLWRDIPATVILYEAPHRLLAVLAEINRLWGDRKIALARELTKIYEEFFRGSVSESLAWLAAKPPRGEFTIVLSGAAKTVGGAKENPALPPLEKLRRLLAAGADKKDSIKKVALEYKISKRELYQALLESGAAGKDEE
ncbi:MAG: 16S rRNA (cytidine(1402)-2'-O)-methyltransferase [Acidaminococcales bacterium]|jgi:16S rRNA (cytidine1402-2'-O)-methyltransferase|nr:16S rRNA (cytidine(1402)-2'-O)-methyltransferase [Acidaminococcales bacterium]